MKLSMTEQERGDLLIQMTAWAGLTVLPVDKLHQVIKMIETTDHKTLRE